jgi:hypothetical protein
MKIEQRECSETSGYNIQTLGNYPDKNAFQLGIWAILFGVVTRIKAEEPRTRVLISGKKMTSFYSKNVHVRFEAQPAPCSMGVGRF